MNPDCYHIPVMPEECIEGLNIKSNGIYLDLTYGGGGHSKEIIKHLAPEGHLYGFDQDLDAMNGAITDERFTFVRSNFRYIKNWMQYYGVEQVDGLLADIGISSPQVDCAERGFSFLHEGPLDMRMNPSAPCSAADIVNNAPEQEIADMINDGNLPTVNDDLEDGGAPAIDLPQLFKEGGVPAPAENAGESKKERKNNGEERPKKYKFLDTYCRNLTKRAEDGKLDRIIGRERELARVIQIL